MTHISLRPLLMLMVLLTSGCSFMLLTSCGADQNKASDKPDGQADASATPLLSYTIATPRPIDEVVTTDGELLAWQRVQLQSEVNARVEGVSMPEGSRVERGAVLIRLDNRELRAELKRVEAALKLARSKLARQQALQENDLASEETVEELQRDVATQEAEQQRLRAAIRKTLIRAPFSGRVGMHTVVAGAYLSPQQTITELVDDRRLKLDFALAEQYTGQVSKGDTVYFTTNVNPDTPQAARIYAVSPSIATDSRRLQVRAEIDNSEAKWKPGLFAEVELPLRRQSRAIMIPNIALIPTRDRKEVFIVRDGKARARALVTGFRNEERVEVIEGLRRGDTVLTSGLLQIQDGQPVRLKAPGSK